MLIMNLSNFLYPLTSVNSFLKKWNDTFDSENYALVEQLLKEKKTHFFIKKIKQSKNSHHYTELHLKYYDVVKNGKHELVRQMAKAGLDINYKSPSLFEAIFDKNCKYHVEPMFQAFVDLGFNFNQTLSSQYQYGKTITQNAIHETLKRFRNNKLVKGYDIAFHIANRRRVLFYKEHEEKFFLEMNPYYPMFKELLNKDIKINQAEENVIALALQKTHSLAIVLDLLNLKGMSVEYIQNGLKDIEQFDFFKDFGTDRIDLKNVLITHFEKIKLEQNLAPISKCEVKTTRKNKI
jgi:hypothetical protein